jgi:hypothetical protein
MQIPDLNDQAALGAPMLDEIRRTAEQRLRQIEPLIDEAERLREVLAVIEHVEKACARLRALAPQRAQTSGSSLN